MAPNLAQAEAFVIALTGNSNTILTLQIIDDTVAKRRDFNRVLTGSIGQLWPIVSRLNQAGAGIFVQINEGRRGARNVTSLRALFVDDDGKGPAFLVPLLPSIVVASSLGERNRHYYWLLKPGESIEAFTPAQRHLIAYLQTDKSLTNLDRVMRLPGTYNNKRQQPEPVSLAFADVGRSPRTIAQVLGAFPLPEEIKKTLTVESQPEIVTESALASMKRLLKWLSDKNLSYTLIGQTAVKLPKCPFNSAHQDFMIRIQPR